MKRYDVVVVGGGPVGSHVAGGLAQAGLNVAVLEKNTDPSSPVCCTGLVSTDCLERFQIDPKLVLNRFNGAVIVSPSGREVRVYREQIQAVALNRPGYNLWMTEQATRHGVDYLTGHRVSSISIGTDGVRTIFQNGTAKSTVASQAAVLANGFGGQLAQSAGIGTAGDWKVGIQCEVELNEPTEVRVYLSRRFAPGAFAWLVPLDAGRGLAGLIARKDLRQHFSLFMEHLRTERRIHRQTSEVSIRGITVRSPSRTFAERVLLVGDAAGQVKPLSGGGIYYGLLCGDMVVNSLKEACRDGDFSARRLSAYQREWRNLLGRELAISYVASALYGQFRDRWIEAMLNLAARRKLFDSLASDTDLLFDWHSQVIVKTARRLLLPK